MTAFRSLALAAAFLSVSQWTFAEPGLASELKKEINELRQSMNAMQQRYESRIRQLEKKVEAHSKAKEQKAEGEELSALLEAAETEAGSGGATAAAPSSNNRSQGSLNAFNPRITAFGDFLARSDDRKVVNDNGNQVGDRASLREVELDFRADVDPYAKGVLIVAFGEEDPNQYATDIEEGYVTLETLPFNLRAKIGRFRTGFGQINKLHRHDLPQSDYPLVVQRFFGEEGDNENGADLSYLFPSFADTTLQLNFEVLNGENADLLAGNSSASPAYLGHLKSFRQLGENRFIEFGVSHLFGYNDADNAQSTNLSGLDFLYKWRPLERSEYNSFVLQSELFYLDKEQPGGDLNRIGAYAYAQYQLNPRWYVGLRGDYVELPESPKRDAWGISPFVSLYTTEFLRLRLGFQHLDEDDRAPLDSIFFQLTFVFGSHPVEPYWVNR